MLEMKEIAPGEVALWEDKTPAGGAVWTLKTLSFGRERVTGAHLSRLEVAPHNAPALWAYLEYLWQPQAVAVIRSPDGSMRWLHQGLRRLWEEAGSPEDWQET